MSWGGGGEGKAVGVFPMQRWWGAGGALEGWEEAGHRHNMSITLTTGSCCRPGLCR